MQYVRTPINFFNEVKVNFDKSMNSLCFSNQPVFSISMQNRMITLQTIRTNSFMVYCIVQFVNCMIFYMPHIFHERQYNFKKEILQASCTCIYIAPVCLLFKFDEFYTSKLALSIPFTISYIVVCGVSQ